MKNLQVHHLQFRSHLGSDLEENLITLCRECHAEQHKADRDEQRIDPRFD
jgi:5-methylcytosine-specific restriction endonuclease McrA